MAPRTTGANTLSQKIFEDIRAGEQTRQAAIKAANEEARLGALRITGKILDDEHTNVGQVTGLHELDFSYEVGALHLMMGALLERKEVADRVEDETGEKIPIGPIDYPGGMIGIRHYTGALLVAAQSLDRPIKAGTADRNVLIHPDASREEAAQSYSELLRSPPTSPED